MTKKILISGISILILSVSFKMMSDLALAERSYHAFGGEICLPIFAFAVWVAVKTVKELWARR